MELLRTCLQDLRYAVRNLLRSRGFTAVAAITLTIGIGANTAIFSIIDTILLRPAAVSQPQPVGQAIRDRSGARPLSLRRPGFRGLESAEQELSGHGPVWLGRRHELERRGAAGPCRAVPTEANFFALLGVHPIIGRTWIAGEDQPGKDQVAVLSYGLWREHFAGDPGVVGRTIALNSKKYTIVGVMPASFRFPFQTTQMWIPLDMDGKSLRTRGSHWAQRHRQAEARSSPRDGAGGPETDRRASRKDLSGFQR
jgi:putative ABC transport system permease protein